MQPTNLLYILSDQHNRNVLGCYGNSVVQTPNLDALAARGARFDSAYTNCPICVPARASLATGCYVHQIGNWDNAFPYDGRVSSWGHRLKDQGFHVDSIGKLHFRGRGDDNGFTTEIDPLHVVEGEGDLLGCIRDNPPFRDKRHEILEAGPGDSTYQRYDISNADHACQWLADHAGDERPWVLFLSFVTPHPRYVAPPEDYGLYDHNVIQLPPQWQRKDWPDHPAIDYFRRFFGVDDGFPEATIRQMNAAYYGVCTFLDRQIGRVLAAVNANGLDENTHIIYTSDHGENLGARGLFGKFTLYEEAAAIPFIMAGPNVPAGQVVNTPVSLVDSHPTILETVGCAAHADDRDLPGESLWSILEQPQQDRTVFSEYHALGSQHAIYMIRDLRYKYIHYVNDEPQLFDLKNDPNEFNNLAQTAAGKTLVTDYEARLRSFLDPEVIDRQAKRDQAERIIEFGGEAKVRARGTFTNSPAPGEAPGFESFS